MSARVAINGFGRIGRNVFRAARDRGAGFEIVAVNDITNAPTLAHLLKYDSIHRAYPDDVSADGDGLSVGGKHVAVLGERDPAALPWGDMGVDVVVESTGFFTKREGASKHLEAGARKVIISAPATEPDFTVCLGVNDGLYDADSHHIISNASCTTNCLAPVAKVLLDSFGMQKGFMTTTRHCWTRRTATFAARGPRR
jgi:glyceraldehyde 3-phosphate dehydrogenase